MTPTDDAVAAAGRRLRDLRLSHQLTLAEVADETGISTSTLSRLEAGKRKATLELLLPLARVYRVSLDDLVDPFPLGDPRVQQRPVHRQGMTMIPLTRRPGGIQAYKIIYPGIRGAATPSPEPRTHEGYEWLYVLNGRLRMLLGEHDLVLATGEAAEFDTRIPHWFGAADGNDVEVLSLFGAQGERAHVRARSTG